MLAFVTMFLKAIGKFNEGDFRANSGYRYVSIVYNVSICLALYCLAMFWVVVNDDLKPFRCGKVLQYGILIYFNFKLDRYPSSFASKEFCSSPSGSLSPSQSLSLPKLSLTLAHIPILKRFRSDLMTSLFVWRCRSLL